MEISPRPQDRTTTATTTLLPSPNSHSSSSSSSNSNNSSSYNNGLLHHHHHHNHHNNHPPPSPTTTPKTPQPQPPQSSNNNPYPTTFVQADTSSFKQVVQLLTGSSETVKSASSNSKPSNSSIPPIKTSSNKSKPSSKLYERRNSLKNLRINPLLPSFGSATASPTANFSPRNAEILSPSLLDFPALVLSPVTPLIPDPFNRSPTPPNGVVFVDKAAEEKAISEKGFFLHPSPRDSEPPKLLPLFPLTSPRVSGSTDHPTS